MKKVIIGIVVAVVVVGAGVGAFMMMKNNAKNQDSADQQLFSPASTDGQALTATVIVTPKKGKKTVTVAKLDGQGNSEYEISNGAKTRMVFTKEAYYTCSKNSCLKISKNSAGTTTDPSSYDFSQADINSLQKNITHTGQEACPGGDGTCDVWTSTGFIDGNSKATVYVNSESKRVVAIHAENDDGAKTEITYNYGPVTVEIPTDVREMNTEIPSALIEE